MKKSSAIRLAGFVGALCASGALIGTAVSGTGAYFTDTHTGAVNASTGHVKVDISPADGQLSYTDLLPGEYQSKNIDYTAHGTGAEDIWLVFPTTSSGGSNPSEAFTGAPDDGVGGGLGRYGHLQITSTNGASFVSNNLSNRPSGDTATDDQCSINGNGWGGSNALATSTNNSDPGSYLKYCAPANAILLASNLTNGQGGTAAIEFGFTRVLKSGQDAPLNRVASFKVVATQHGIRPDDTNTGTD